MDYTDVTLPKYDAYVQQDWIELMQNERRIELVAEGMRYDDIIRWGIVDGVLNQPALGHTRKINNELLSLKIEDRSFESHMFCGRFMNLRLRLILI